MIKRLFGSSVQLLLRAVGILTSLIVVVILARYLGPEAYGALAAGLTVTGILSAISDSGIYPLGVRRIAHEGLRLRLATQMVRARLLLVLLFFPFMIAVARLLGTSAWWVVVICASGAIPYAFVAYRAIPEAAVRPALVGLIIVAQNLTWLLLVGVAVALRLTLEHLAVLSIVAICVQALLAYIAARRTSDDVTSVSGPLRVSEVLREALPLVFSSLLVTAYYRGGQLLVFANATPEEGASYLAAFRLLDAAQVVPASAMSIYLPLVVRHGADREGRVKTLRKFALLLVGGSGIITLAVVLASPLIAQLLLGKAFPSAGHFVAIVFLAFPLICVGYLMSSTLLGIGRHKVVALVSSGVAAAGLVVVWLTAVHIGPEAAATAVVAVEFVHALCLAITLAFSLRRAEV